MYISLHAGPCTGIRCVIDRSRQNLPICAGQPRQVLAELDARHGRRDRPELAADLDRGLGLHVPEVDVAGPAEEEDEDAGVCPLRGRRGSPAAVAARSRASSGIVSPSALSAPARRISRRVAGSPRPSQSLSVDREHGVRFLHGVASCAA